jgi:hypothetical protein
MRAQRTLIGVLSLEVLLVAGAGGLLLLPGGLAAC